MTKPDSATAQKAQRPVSARKNSVPGQLAALRRLPLDGRRAALECLLHCQAGRTVQEALAEVLAGCGLAQTERHLCTELVYGCLRQQLRMQALLARVLPRPQALPQLLHCVLYLGLYALLFQDRIPPHAAVSTAVDQARTLFGQALSRVVNGALRSVQRLGPAVALPSFYEVASTDHKARSARSGARQKDPGHSPAPQPALAASVLAASSAAALLSDSFGHGQQSAAELSTALETGRLSWAALCTFYSLPLWLGQLWHRAYGTEICVRLMQRSAARPWTALRLNPVHAQAAELHRAFDALVDAGAAQAVGHAGFAFAPGAMPERVLDRS